MPDFVHLHCHTEYSLLDGAIRLGDLCARAAEFKMPAAAITDHGNMFGAAKFFVAAKNAGIKPIIGCETYVAKRRHDDRESEDARTMYHLVLLAQNFTGYRNLVRLVTQANLSGFHYKPRVDKELLRAHSEGLVALSACLQGEVPRALLDRGFDAGLAAAREYADIFPGRFYIELQANGIEDQRRANEALLELAAQAKLPLVGTNDCHYLRRDDAPAHDILLCVQTNACVEDEKRMRLDTEELYYRSPDEMAVEFAHCPEAIENTVRIAEQCNVELPLNRHFFPVYETDPGKTLAQVLREMAATGLDERLEVIRQGDPGVDEAVYRQRLDMELDVIEEMGFPGYFLIVQDFINWAKEQGIPVGPGRGSAAGSLVAFALRITNLDPLPYNLLFERFLNIERVSMPDIDVDFCERRRGEVIRYVSEKYGHDSVAQITTFGTMKAKAVIRDVGRALGMTFAETDRIAKLIPDELKMTISKALDREPELRELMNDDQRVARLIDVSRRLEGLHRHASTHAAGVVIADKPLWEYLPLYKGKKDEVVTQFDMKMVEKVGLIKFDFLGLRTMTVIQDTLDIIREGGLEPPDLDVLSLDDEATYALYSRGDTDGIFQVESDGMRRYLRMLRPSCFDDVIAMLALYRPGPLNSGMVDEFIMRKQGQKKVVYPLPELEPVLRDTYGVIVYQEQVMKIAQVVAGYSLGGADLLRRAMGKKNAEAMAKQREIFLTGAVDKGVDKAKATEIFDLMEKFAEYGFNKSHSAAYALISYYTAYLKTHFPTQFMAALMTSEVNNQDKLLKYINACRDMDIEVLKPDVNVSLRHFTVPEDKRVYYGLGGVKNVGDEAIRSLVEAREEDGPFGSLLDLCVRVNLRQLNKRVLESLIKSGAMDSLGCHRAHLMNHLERVVALAQKKARDKESGQMSLFAAAGMEEPACPGLGFETAEDTPAWPDDELLRQEKEALGFYLSSHPLLPYRQEMKRLGLVTLDQCVDMPPGTQVKTACIVIGVREYITKKGTKMAFVQVEDLVGVGDLTMFPEIYADTKAMLGSDEPLLLTAEISGYKNGYGEDDDGPRQAKLQAVSVGLLSEAVQGSADPVRLDADPARLDGPGLDELRAILGRHPGRAPVHLAVRLGDSYCEMELGGAWRVQPCPEMWSDIRAWQGLSDEEPETGQLVN